MSRPPPHPPATPFRRGVRLLLVALAALASLPAGAVAGSPGARPDAATAAASSPLRPDPRAASGFEARGARSEPAPEDGLWSDRFALAEFDGTINALVEFRGELIAAGNFVQAGGVPATHVARWNGQRWAPLGAGISGVPLALAVVGDRLYAAGYRGGPFGGAPGLINEWDGTGWTDVTANLEGGAISSLAVWQGTLVAAGSIESGSEWIPGVARYQGGQWTLLGDLSASAGWIQAVVADGSRLYAGGSFGFTTPGAVTPVVLEFAGGSWDTIARARNDYQPHALALAIDRGDLVVGGGFVEIEGVPADGLARRHDGVWTGVPGSGGSWVAALRSSDQGLLAGGSFGSLGGAASHSVARWTAAGWQGVGRGLWWGVHALIEYQGRVIAGGRFTQDGDFTQRLISIASWDGTAWAPLRGEAPSGDGLFGFDALFTAVTALEVLDGFLHAGGSFYFANDLPIWSPSRGVVRWNGLGWTPLGPREFNGAVRALAWYHGGVIAGGSFGLPHDVSNIARWNGTAWEPLGTGTDGPVHALEVWNGVLYAAGSFTSAGGLLASGIARWDGTRWLPAGASVTPGPVELRALAVHGGRLIAGGAFSAIGAVAVSNVAAWDGAAWAPLGGGRPAPVHALEVHGGMLWAGGEFVPGETPAPPVLAWWDGTAWSHPPEQPEGSVTGLCSSAGALYVAGGFRRVGLRDAGGIARLEDAGWDALGQGLGSSAWTPLPVALVEFAGGLWVGGGFTLAGGRSSFHVARWEGLPRSASVAPAAEPARPNPFSRSTAVRFRLPPGATGSIDVLDLGGRRIRTLRSGALGWGPIDATWDGRNDAGAIVAGGVYFIRLRSAAGDRTARVAFVP